MLDIAEDIHSLTEFKRNTSEYMIQLKASKRPLVLTVNGRAELVVHDAKSYQRLLKRLDHLEAVEAIRQGLKDVEEGRIQDARPGLEALRVKLGLPR